MCRFRLDFSVKNRDHCGGPLRRIWGRPYGAPHPAPEGWAFPGAPEFVRQSQYTFEFNAYTGR